MSDADHATTGGEQTAGQEDVDDTTGDERPSGLPRIRARAEAAGPRRIALYVLLTALLVAYLSPLWSGMMTSVKSQLGFAVTSPYAPPTPEYFVVQPWFDAYERLQSGMINSVLFAVPATVLSALFGSMAAFGLTKLDWRGQLGVLLLFVAAVFIPYQSVLVPLRVFWGTVGVQSLLQSWAATLSVVPLLSIPFRWAADRADLIELAITHTAYGIPICTVLFRGYYFTIDDDIIEAAKMDGASTFGIYRRIVLPMSKPMFAVTLIYQFTNIWNDLLFALVLVSTSDNHVATQALNELQGAMVQEYNTQMAAAFIVALPTLIIYVVFGKQFAEGITGAGA